MEKGDSNAFDATIDHLDKNGLEEVPVAEISSEGSIFFHTDVSDNVNTDDVITKDPLIISADGSVEVITKDPPAVDIEKDDDDDDDGNITVDPIVDNDATYDDYSNSALIALTEIQEGNWDLKIEDIPKDLDPSTLRQLYRKELELKSNSFEENLVNSVERGSEYIKFLLNGGDPNVLKEALSDADLMELDVSSVENQKKIITRAFEYKELPPEDIEDIVNGIIDRGVGSNRALQEQELLKTRRDATLKNAQTQKAEQERVNSQQYNAFVSSISDVISSKTVGGIKITAKKAKELEDAMFKPTEVVEYVDPNTQRTASQRMTKVQLLQNELNKDPEKLASFYLWLLEGGKFDFVKSQVSEEKDNAFASLLNSRGGSTASTKPVKRSRNAFDDIASKYGR